MIRFIFSVIICISFSALNAQVSEKKFESFRDKQLSNNLDSIQGYADEQIEDEHIIIDQVDSANEKLPHVFELDTYDEYSELSQNQRLTVDSLRIRSDFLKDSLATFYKKPEDLLSEQRNKEVKKIDTFSDSLDNQKAAMDEAFDVDKILEKYDKEMLEELPSMNSSVLKQKKIPLLDSLRSQYLKQEKLKFKEKEITDEYKQAALEKKESFFKKSFFDGILGINEDFKVFNVSPAYGLQFSDRFSSGIGVNLGINLNKPSENILVGIRSFMRYEILKKKLYVQLEDNSYWPGISYPNWESELREGKVKHSISIGAGYMLKFAPNKSLNLAFLYQLNNKTITSDFNAPVVMRLGISLFNK